MNDTLTEKDLHTLGNYKEFSNFLQFIVYQREDCLQSMHKASPNDLMQISGRILAYDDIIKVTDAHRVIRRHE